MFEQNVKVLGADYKITVKGYSDEKQFEENSWAGWCCEYTREIVLCDLKTWPGWEKEQAEKIDACMKKTLRHEITHAFFYESGLHEDSATIESGWACNEEMVDWFAAQGPKIYKAWKEVGAI